jgi:teichuronic acid biosynthesis glycosyltransferase TuaC
MRLLFITNVFPNPLQPTRGMFNYELVRALSAGHEVRVVSPIAWTDEWRRKRGTVGMPRGRWSNPAGLPGVKAFYPRYLFTPKVFRDQYGRFMWYSVRGTVRRQVASFRPDAVLGYWVHPDGAVAVRAARLAGVPSAIMVGGSDVLVLTTEPARRKRILNVLNIADVVIPVSEDLGRNLAGLGVAPEKIKVVPRGVDRDRFSPGSSAEARRRLGIGPGGPVVLWVGRMHPVKGLDVLVDACARLRSQGVSFRLYLVGDGPERDRLQRQAETLGVSELISFPGSVAHVDLPDWYRAADVMVLPSRSEGVPNVLRESLACGTPFVASRVGGIPEITPDPGWLVPPEDPAALAEGIAAAIAPGTHAPPGRSQSSGGAWSDSAESIVRILEAARAGRCASAGPELLAGAVTQ